MGVAATWSRLVAAAPAIARGQTITARDLVLRGHGTALNDKATSAALRRTADEQAIAARIQGVARNTR